MRRSWLSGSCSLLLGALLLAAPASAEPLGTDAAGELLFVHYCSSCHGPEGRGDGPLAPILSVAPANLTQIANENGGEFPYLDVVRAIDGRRSVRAHGTAQMPVWGNVFLADSDAPLSEQLAGAGKLLLIAARVEALQETSMETSR